MIAGRAAPPSKVFRYSAWGVELSSDVPLASLTLAGASEPRGERLSLRTSATPFEEPTRWLYNERFEDTGELWRAVGVSPRGVLVRVFERADFFLAHGGSEALVWCSAGAAESLIEPLFLEQALPLWLSLLGRPCLHASAVVWGEGEAARAVAFAGRSGSGKSTLATSLAAAGGLIADDCLVMEVVGEEVLAHPSHRAVRLLGDAAEAFFASTTAGELSADGGKRRLGVRGASRTLSLSRIYMLEPATGAAGVFRLSARDAVARLASHFFRVDPEDRARLGAELALLERVATRTRVARLAVPRRFAGLAEVHAVIAADLAGG